MHRNLEANDMEAVNVPSSVHLCEFPQADPSLIDGELSADMEALLRLVSIGSAVRNSVKIKVRQPLAEIKIRPASDAERHAVLRFSEQIAEELNVKKVSLHNRAEGPLLRYEIKANLKSLGPKLGPRLKEVQNALAAQDPLAVTEKIQANGSLEVPTPGGPVLLESNDIFIDTKAPDGWAGLAEGSTQVIIDVRVTQQLAFEGTAREIVRHIQDLRKQAGLEMEDRIRLHLATQSPAVREAIETHAHYIRGETLAVELSREPVNGDAHKSEINLQGDRLTIELAKTVRV
jgi:isoleucyl-tRNA synthetase